MNPILNREEKMIKKVKRILTMRWFKSNQIFMQLFESVMVEISNLIKTINPQVQESQKVPRTRNMMSGNVGKRVEYQPCKQRPWIQISVSPRKFKNEKKKKKHEN
jgi:hypothetical protein